MKLAILSDSHDVWENLQQAITLATDQSCDLILFAGDFIAPNGLEYFQKFPGSVHLVWGNNEGEIFKFTRSCDQDNNLNLAGDVYEDTIDGIKIFMNHYPRITELAAKSGEFDLCIHGHTHIYREETFNNTLLLNPGALKGDKQPPSFIIYDTTDRTHHKILL